MYVYHCCVRLLEIFKEPSILVLKMFQNRRTMSSGCLKKSESNNWATSVIVQKLKKEPTFFFSLKELVNESAVFGLVI